jgi:hypothetical protein
MAQFRQSRDIQSFVLTFQTGSSGQGIEVINNLVQFPHKWGGFIPLRLGE